MGSKRELSAEEMLQQIFYYMNCLVVEKDFSTSILLLTDLGRTLVNAERASFWYRDTKKKQYWTLAASDTERIVVPEGIGIIGASIENNETILLNAPYEDSRFNPQVDKETGYVTKSILCMPVTNEHGEVIGAYQAINKLSADGINRFDEQDVKRLALAAAYSGKMLEMQILREQNQIDQLTGLKNRKGFYDCYENRIIPSMKTAKAGVIMCDIDFFKKVNDTYGHNVGDAVLIHVANLMQNYIGSDGDVFRWGGEEFMILLTDCDLEKAFEIASKLREQVRESECHAEEQTVKITMSFGVKEIESTKTADKNIKEVDEKLYEAKQSGRDKVVG